MLAEHAKRPPQPRRDSGKGTQVAISTTDTTPAGTGRRLR
jgi:hypothetical protein